MKPPKDHTRQPERPKKPDVPPVRKVQVGRLLRHVPGCWEQLRGADYVRVHLARLLQQPERRRLAITMALLKVHPLHDWRMWWAWKTQLTATEMQSLLQLADPFIDAHPLDTWQLPTLRVGRRWARLVCRTHLLDSLGAEHWGEVDAHFMHWQQDGDFDHLRRMAALLYTTGPTDLWALREGASIALANRMKERHLLAIGANWSQCRQLLVQRNPHVFGGGSKEKQARRVGWGTVLMSSAGGRLGPWKEVRTTPIGAFMAHLDLAMKEAREAKARLKNPRA